MPRWPKWLEGLADSGTYGIEIRVALREADGPLNEATVEWLAHSIAQIGMLHPIYVKPSDDSNPFERPPYDAG